MKLMDFLNQKKIKIEHFSVLIGYASAYVKRVALGKKRPSKQIIACIESFTCGQVTETDMLQVYRESNM